MERISGYANLNGAKIYYEVVGEGRSVVFVHAGVADHRMWDDQFPVFANDYRVIRYDLRGFGDTAPVFGDYTHRDDLFALLEFLNIESAYLIGCSMGGGVIMDFALEHPSMVKALVMVGAGPAGLELDIPMPAKFTEMQRAAEEQEWERFLELSAQIWFDGEGRRPDQVNAQKRALMMEMYRKALNYRSQEQGKNMPLQPSAAQRLGELNLPVLIVCGTRDTPFLRAAADFMESHITGAKRVMIPDTAHLPSMDRPDEFNRIVLDFLKSV